MSKTRMVCCVLSALAVSGNGPLSAATLQQDSVAARDAAATAVANAQVVELIKQLLESGTGPDAEVPADWGWEVPSGTTLLMWAAARDHVELVELLLARGADTEVTTSEGLTALIFAAFPGNTRAIEVLLDNGADVHATGPVGMTAVQLAARNGHSEAVDVLVRYGAATTEAEAYRDVMGEDFVLPRASNVEDRPNEDGDVVLGIDRDGMLYLDSGDGAMAGITGERLAGVLSAVYTERTRDRILCLVSDPTVEYEVLREVVDIATRSGVRVLAAVAERKGEPVSLSRYAMDVQLPPQADQAPEGSPRPLLMPLGPGNVVLQLLDDGSYAVNVKPVLLSQLDARMHEIFDNRPAKLLFVQVADNRPYQEVITAMDIARGAGVQVIGFAPPGEVPQAIPPVDLRERFDPRDYTGVGVEGGVAGDSAFGEQIFKDAVVDVAPQLVSCPPVHYPEEMRQAAIEGVVVLQFVVEIDGHVKPENIAVLRSTHEAFVAPAKEMLAGCTFRPGEVRGTAVRVLAEIPLTFTLQ
jgi:biopolymer transport protein ExbD